MVGSYYSRRPSVRVTLVVVEQSRLICQWCGLRFAWGNVRFCKNRFTSNDQEVMISLHFMSIIVTQFSIKTWCVNGWSPNNCNFVDISDGTCPQWCNRYFFQLTLSFCRWWRHQFEARFTLWSKKLNSDRTFSTHSVQRPLYRWYETAFFTLF